MLNQFKQWLHEVGEAANTIKRETKARGEVVKPWYARQKNIDIKKRFHDEGKARGYTSNSSNHGGERLYDFRWAEIDKDNNLLGVVLAMEIEMSDNKEYLNRYDFKKLLQADSVYKVLVFQLDTEKEILQAMQQLKDAAEKYKFRCDSEFLLCCWSTVKGEFIFDEFKAIAKS